MIPVCLYFQVHQPLPAAPLQLLRRRARAPLLRRRRATARSSLASAERCYLPATAMLERLLERHPRFAVSFSLSGCLLEQLRDVGAGGPRGVPPPGLGGARARRVPRRDVAPLARLARLAGGVRRAGRAPPPGGPRDASAQEPRVFRNTELIYSDALAAFLEEQGYRGRAGRRRRAAARGRARARRVYRAATPRGLPLLLRDYRLSDDIAFRFSNRSWTRVAADAGEVRPLDLARRGRRRVALHGFRDLRRAPAAARPASSSSSRTGSDRRLARRGAAFLTPSEAIARLPAGDTTVGPADALLGRRGPGRLGLAGQRPPARRARSGSSRSKAASRPRGSGARCRRLPEAVDLGPLLLHGDQVRRATGRCTPTSRPYESPYEAYIAFMHVLSDLERRLPRPRGRPSAATEPARPAARA